MATDAAWSARVKVKVQGEEDATDADVVAFFQGDNSQILSNALSGRSLVARARAAPAAVVAPESDRTGDGSVEQSRASSEAPAEAPAPPEAPITMVAFRKRLDFAAGMM